MDDEVILAAERVNRWKQTVKWPLSTKLHPCKMLGENEGGGGI